MPVMEVPRRTFGDETGCGWVTAYADRMQPGTDHGTAGKTDGVHKRWDLGVSRFRTACEGNVIIMAMFLGFRVTFFAPSTKVLYALTGTLAMGGHPTGDSRKQEEGFMPHVERGVRVPGCPEGSRTPRFAGDLARRQVQSDRLTIRFCKSCVNHPGRELGRSGQRPPAKRTAK